MKNVVYILFLLLSLSAQLEAQASSSSSAQAKTGESDNKPNVIIGLDAYREVLESGVYRVGAGDDFLIYSAGMEEPYHSLVLAEGGLFIPQVGIVKVGGLNLMQMREAVKEAFAEVFKQANIDIELSRPRTFPVAIIGAVIKPGVRLATGIERVSEVVSRVKQMRTNASKRNIRLIKGDSIDVMVEERIKEMFRRGDTGGLESISQRVDLEYYGITGESRYNPFIEDGDFVIVPRSEGQLEVQGAVQNPGTFEFVSGDRISDLLTFAHGTAPNADLDNVELFRYKEDNKTMAELPVDLRGVLAKDPAADLELQPGDMLIVRVVKGFREQSTVIISGEVHHPGAYVISQDGTPLRDIVAKAGGFTKGASLSETMVVRPPSETERSDPEFERISSIPVSDRKEEDDQYFIMKSRERVGKMVVDLESLYNESKESESVILEPGDENEGKESESVILEPGDEIEIPPVRRVVHVSGQAADPGMVLYDSTFTVWDYIDKAGGPGWRASKEILVIKARTGERQRAEDVEQIEPGDRIWIKETPERDFWLLFTQTMGVVGEVSTVVLLFVTLTK